MPSVELIRSPFDNVFSFLGTLPQGHEKALKHALYNAVALLLLMICMACGWALYIVLGPFLTPLLWALMCGSVLYPFKRSLTSKLFVLISSMEPTNSPVLWRVSKIPLYVLIEVSELVGSILMKYIKHLLYLILGTLVVHLVYSYTPHLCVCIIWRIGLLIGAFLSWLISYCTTSVVVTVIAAYLGLLALFWTPDQATKFELTSWPIWIILSCYLANLIGTFHVSFFFLIQLGVIIALCFEVWQLYNLKQEEGTNMSLYSSLKIVLSEVRGDTATNEGEIKDQEEVDTLRESDIIEKELFNESIESQTGTKDNEDTSTSAEIEKGEPSGARQAYIERPTNVAFEFTNPSNPPPSMVVIDRRLYNYLQEKQLERTGDASEYHSIFSQEIADQRNTESDKYLYTLMWACLSMLVFHHLWVLTFVPIPIFVYFVKHTGQYFGVWNLINAHWENVKLCVMTWYNPRRHAFFPAPVMCVSREFVNCHRIACEKLRNSVDAVASVAVIFFVIVFSIGTVTFILVKVYGEGIHMIQVGASVVNSTVVSNSEFFNQIIPVEWYDNMDSMLGNAYSQGREGISTMVRGWLTDVDKAKAAHLEKQVLDIWDRIYQAWIMSGTDQQVVGPVVQPMAIWENLVDSVQKSQDLFNFDTILDFGRKNMDSVMSVLTTVWTISKGNLTLLFTFITTLLSVVFGGGTALLNFLLSIVVFFTALFYLLSTSGELYKPVEMITNFSPTYGNRFALALEESFVGVFKASFKMAAFYGLWTWLIHNIFQMKIVYIPSVLASILAAVPFLGTYCACVPAVLDLWLAQGKGMHAILLFAFQFLPISAVDTAIYKEIRGGGHPYLTGLSIAGGIFCMGVQGAIIGPLLLCGLFVAINMSSKLMMDSPSDEKLSQHFSQQISKQIQASQASQASAFSRRRQSQEALSERHNN